MRKVHSGAISDKDLIFSALSDVYFGLYFLDLPGNVYSTIKMAPGEEQIEANESELSVVLQNFINNVVAPDDREKMREFMNMDTLQLRLGSNKCVDCEYVQGYLYAHPIPVDDFERQVLAGAMPCAEEVYNPASTACRELRDASNATKMMGEMVPNPMALIECSNGQFSLLRANPALISEFGLNDDVRLTGELFREHLDSVEYDRTLKALEKCASDGKSICFRVIWNKGERSEPKNITKENSEEDIENDIEGNVDKKRRYIIHADFKGDVGTAKMFIVLFTNENPENYFE